MNWNTQERFEYLKQYMYCFGENKEQNFKDIMAVEYLPEAQGNDAEKHQGSLEKSPEKKKTTRFLPVPRSAWLRIEQAFCLKDRLLMYIWRESIGRGKAYTRINQTNIAIEFGTYPPYINEVLKRLVKKELLVSRRCCSQCENEVGLCACNPKPSIYIEYGVRLTQRELAEFPENQHLY